MFPFHIWLGRRETGGGEAEGRLEEKGGGKTDLKLSENGEFFELTFKVEEQ